MESSFRILCEFGSCQVVSGGFLGEEKLFICFRKSRLLHVVDKATDAIECVRFSHAVTWATSDTRTLMAATSDGRIWEIPLTEIHGIIRDVDEKWAVASEDNIACFIVTTTFLATLKRCEYTQCLSLYDRCKETRKLSQTPRLQLHFPVNDSANSHIDDIINTRVAPLLCLVSEPQYLTPGTARIDPHLFIGLIGSDATPTNTVILYGDDQGVIRCVAVSDSEPCDDSDSDFEWSTQTDPPVVCCIDQPIHSLHTGILPIQRNGSLTDKHNAVIVIGCFGRVVLITANDENRLVFHDYNVDSPVIACCVVACHWLIYATNTDVYSASLVLSEEEQKTMSERVLLTASMGKAAVQEQPQIAFRITLKSIPLSLTHVTWLYPYFTSCVALTQSGCLYQFEWPNEGVKRQRSRLSAKSGERKLQEILKSLGIISKDMERIENEKMNVDVAIKNISVSMNVLCDFLDVHRGKAKPEKIPLKIDINPEVKDNGLPGCETSISIHVCNSSDYNLPAGWSLIVCIESLSHLSSSTSPLSSSVACSSLSNPTATRSFTLKDLNPSMFARFEVFLPKWTSNSLVPMQVKCIVHYNASVLLNEVSLMPGMSSDDVPACTITTETAQFDVLDFVRPHSRLAPPPVSLKTPQTDCDVDKLLHQLQRHKQVGHSQTSGDSHVASVTKPGIKVTSLLVSRVSPMLVSLTDNPEDSPAALLHRLLQRNTLCKGMNLRCSGKQTSVKLLTPWNVSVDLQAMFVEKARLGSSAALGLVPKDVELTILSAEDETLASVRAAVVSRFVVSKFLFVCSYLFSVLHLEYFLYFIYYYCNYTKSYQYGQTNRLTPERQTFGLFNCLSVCLSV